jgi:hypothetical protein
VLALAVLAACSSNKARSSGDDAVTAPVRTDAAVPIDAAPPATGDVLVRVEWKAVPAAVRASPGRTPCNTPRAPSVAPTTTWGIPDVLVLVDGVVAKPSDARIVIADCAFAPRVAAGSTLVVESAVDRPTAVTLTKRGAIGDPAALAGGDARAIQLPITGHQASIALDPGALYELALDAESAWVAAGFAAVTEASGTVLLEDLPVGTHRITAWLPPRAGQSARIAKGEATIIPAGQVELTLQLE